MASEIVINVRPSETRVAVLDKGILTDFMIESNRKKGLAGSIFRGKVMRVLPGMQAAFVDIGLDRAAFLYVGDVHNESVEDSHLFFEESSGEEDGAGDSGKDERPHIPKAQIQDLLKEGQELLVQVAKDPLGTKGARITTHISLAGRNIVYLPMLGHFGISRRIESEEERNRLKHIIEQYKPSAGGVIVRTAGEGATEESLKADIEYLTLLYDDVIKNYRKKKNVGLIYAELDVELRAVRDMLTQDVSRVVVDNPESYRKIQGFLRQFMPKVKARVSLYDGPRPLFDTYDIDLELSRALERKVWLKSGGYIIIDEAEALVVIDVNTGSYVGKKDLEETILKTNLEAVREIAHQLRIRNCGGIIIVDFIDMEKEANREKVMAALREELKKDRARTNLSQMSALGLVEMTRKRIRPSLVKTLCEPCEYCEGKGYIKTPVSVAYEIFRAVEREYKGRKGTVIVRAHRDVAQWAYDEESEMLEFLEDKLDVRVVFKAEPDYHIEQFEIETGGIEALES